MTIKFGNKRYCGLLIMKNMRPDVFGGRWSLFDADTNELVDGDFSAEFEAKRFADKYGFTIYNYPV